MKYGSLPGSREETLPEDEAASRTSEREAVSFILGSTLSAAVATEKKSLK